ncbi:Fucose 4-O-acetylase and related acetyltransferases [uncultured Roseburia sp.]|uniref:Acyltransferase family protein n=1 Tax=Brotonthovivens ammoniilytica TaxID=2981725 RepID=A0ABT2TN37_9FIRM|nr:acyltransferase family protein [Brotonthovivens ammoniilytica]MCU6763639.1 acyltransferase family protein [Brotonthovivens ammoniilytica]SCJ28998.1 Fucose 4-O-acetylase and related acetyltransferases [uncultured Roseburia sp.]
MIKKRNAYFDNMKAMLIFLVVLGHVLSNFGGEGSLARWLYLMIFSFHMPVFLFVSGYFAKPDPKKVIARLLILYLIFQVLQEAVQYMIDFVKHPSEAAFEFQLFFPLWTLWYLLALILYNILLPTFDTDDPKKQIRNLVIAFAMGMLISYSTNTDNFLAANRVVTFLPFYLTGYYGKINGNIDNYLKNRKKIKSREMAGRKIAAAALVAGMLLLFWQTRDLWHKDWLYGTDSYIGTGLTPWIKLLTYVLAYIWLFVFLILMPKRRIGFLTKIGRNTLGIYLFHSIVIIILREIPGFSGKMENTIVWSILLSVLITWVLSRDPVAVFLDKFQYKRKLSQE